jgi:hypothetical protein
MSCSREKKKAPLQESEVHWHFYIRILVAAIGSGENTRKFYQCCGTEIIFFRSVSGFNQNFGSGFGSRLFMKNTVELQII